MNLFKQINSILEKYINEDGRIPNSDCIQEIEELFSSNNIDYAENDNWCDCGPGYEQRFYVFSWIENEKIQTYDILIEFY